MATSLVRQQQRTDTSAQWALWNPVLLPGEIGLDSDQDRTKVGDGVTAWLDLDFSDVPLTARGMVNILDFGAVCDGVTNDLPAVQAAHDALPDTGGTIWFPGPTNLVGSTVSGGTMLGLAVWKDNVTLAGPGKIVETDAARPTPGYVIPPEDDGDAPTTVPARPAQRTVVVSGGGKIDPLDPLKQSSRDIYQTIYPILPAAEGAMEVYTVIASDAAFFTTDDDILLQTDNFAKKNALGNVNRTPDAELGLVAGPGDPTTGRIRLQWPLGAAYTQKYQPAAGPYTGPGVATDQGQGSLPLGVTRMTDRVTRNFKCYIPVEGHVENHHSIHANMATGILVADSVWTQFGAAILGGRMFRDFEVRGLHVTRPNGGPTTANNNWWAPSTGCSRGSMHHCTLLSDAPRKFHQNEALKDVGVEDCDISMGVGDGVRGLAVVSPRARSYRARFNRNKVRGAFIGASEDLLNYALGAYDFEVIGNTFYTPPGRNALSVTGAGSTGRVIGNRFPPGSTFSLGSGVVAGVGGVVFDRNTNCPLDAAPPSPFVSAYRTSDSAPVTNSDVLVDATVLRLTGLIPGATYELSGTIYYSAHPDADAKLALGSNDVLSGHWNAEGPAQNAASTNAAQTTSRQSATLTVGVGGLGTGGVGGTFVKATLAGRVVMGAAGTEFYLRYAQQAPHASDLVIGASSVISLRRL